MRASTENDYKLRALRLSAFAILSVVFVELSLGLAVGSLAIISDGLHATLDAVTTVILFATTRASLKPPDEEHMYGHEKFESMGGLVGGVALIGVALLIMYQAAIKITQNASINIEFQYAGFIAVAYTFLIDFFRVSTLIGARSSQSPTLKAGFYHAIADLSSTVIAFVGFGLATLGFNQGDAMASIALSIMLAYLSVRVARTSGMELSDAIPREIVQKVRNAILNTEGVYKCESLRVRKAGTKTFVEATVKVPDFVGLEEAHDLASKVEANVKSSIGDADVTIHVEPLKIETRTERLVQKLTSEVRGVKETHEISAAYTDDKLYITLHARVDPKLSLDQAHAIAQQIEDRINERIRNVENVTVHMEPFDIETQNGCQAKEEEIKRIVESALTDYKQNFRVRRIVTYVAGRKRYINIDCTFTLQISVEDAHRVASQIENTIKEQFAETIVTVHIEPQ